MSDEIFAANYARTKQLDLISKKIDGAGNTSPLNIKCTMARDKLLALFNTKRPRKEPTNTTTTVLKNPEHLSKIDPPPLQSHAPNHPMDHLRKRVGTHTDFLLNKRHRNTVLGGQSGTMKNLGDATNADNQCDDHAMDDDRPLIIKTGFVTAKTKLREDIHQRRPRAAPSYGKPYSGTGVFEHEDDDKITIAAGLSESSTNTTGQDRSQQQPSRPVRFVPPLLKGGAPGGNTGDGSAAKKNDVVDEKEEEMYKGIDPNIIELIKNEILDTSEKIGWDQIAGLEHAKKTIQEIVIWPMLRPDIFKGLRGPPKGLLLFGPPGTGKTLIGKCIASQSGATFFSISASSLTSKWVGEGEKMVRALFAVARYKQPAVIFIDEIDSILSSRSETEHESSRRIKTEFLVQLDGAGTGSEDRILVVGATNRPQELDEAARRRLVKRLYIPLPNDTARKQIIGKLLSQFTHTLSDEQLDLVIEKTNGYSGADMANLCKEAALGPIRSLNHSDIMSMDANDVRPIDHADFANAILQVRASVGASELNDYIKWNEMYGSMSVG